MSIRYKLEKYDENFDLFKDELPDSLLHYFGDQLDRARNLLKNRNIDEITYGIESLDWMLRKGSELFIEGLDEAFKSKDIVFSSRVKAMQLFKDNIDLDDQESFPGATWSEYFALLTFVYILEISCANSLEHDPGTSEINRMIDESRKENIKQRIIEYAIESMDAVSHAEGLHNLELLTSEIKSKTAKEIGKKGATIKAQKFDAIKRKIITLYLDKFENRSNREAAKRVYQELQTEINEISTSDDPEKQIEKWLGQFKKGTLNIKLNT